MFPVLDHYRSCSDSADGGKRLSKHLRAASLRGWGEVWQSIIHKMAEDSHITTKNSKLGKIFLSFVDTIEGFYDPSILALIR